MRIIIRNGSTRRATEEYGLFTIIYFKKWQRALKMTPIQEATKILLGEQFHYSRVEDEKKLREHAPNEDGKE